MTSFDIICTTSILFATMPPKKRQRFDPEAAKRKVKVKKETTNFKIQLEEYADVLMKHSTSIPGDFSFFTSQLRECAELSIELFLVANIQGLKDYTGFS